MLFAISLYDVSVFVHVSAVVVGQAGDQPRDAVAQLQREVGRRGAHQLAQVVDGDLALRAQALRLLGLGHWEVQSPVSTGWISRRASMRDCTSAEMADSSPISQP